MANSAGGVLVYGIDEQRKSNGPIQLDGGIDPNEISTEWLEQVIDSGIQRRIDAIQVHPVKMSTTGRLAYVVWVPQSNRAPHMASDHRYYKRLGTTTALMEEYEVRDVSRRSEAPDLHLDIKAKDSGVPDRLIIEPRISNRSAEPVLYATCRMYIEHGLVIQLTPNLHWSRLEDTEMLWNKVRFGFYVLRQAWSVPRFLEGEEYQMDSVPVSVGVDYKRTPEVRMYNIGWELRAPRAVPRLQGLKLIVDATGPSLGKDFVTLAVP